MATYVNDLRLKEIATGDESGTWGTSTNTNLELIGEALGYGTQDCFSSDANATTTVADGATDPARAMYFKITSSATLSATRELTIAPNTVSRVMIIENATTGSQIITIKQGSGNTVNVGNGAVKILYLDGAGSGAAVQDALVDLDLTGTTSAVNLDISGNIDVDGTTNLDAVDIDGAVQIDNTVTVGADDTGYDVKFFGATASAYMLWDESADDLILAGAARVVVPASGLVIGSTAVTSTAAELNVLDPALKENSSIWIGSDPSGTTSTAQYNVALGVNALDAITTADRVTAVGYNALSALTTGSSNTAVGDEALLANTSGNSNVAVGGRALTANTVGDKNTAVGYQSLYAMNPAGNADMYNTAVGYGAGLSLTTGVNNTLIGGLAGEELSTGSYNTHVGYNAGGGASAVAHTGDYNSSLGRNALSKIEQAAGANTALGFGTLENLTTASNNTAVGGAALQTLTTGASNVAVGNYAGDAITSAGLNTLVGYASGSALTTSQYNVAVGHSALYSTTTGDLNIAVGYRALYDNTVGDRNTAIGYEALRDLEPASNADMYNVALGFKAGAPASSGTAFTGTANTLLGSFAGSEVTSGGSNVAVGYQAGGGDSDSAATGSSNVAVGRAALLKVTSGYENVAVGAYSMQDITTGDNNVAVGMYSLDDITEGTDNVAIGRDALGVMTAGSGSIAIGRDSLRTANVTSGITYNTAVGTQTGYDLTTGSANSMFGYAAGRNIEDAVNNTCVGVNAGYAIEGGDNNLMLGKDTGMTGSPGGNIVSANNYIVLGDENIASANIQVDWTVASDARDKTDFTALDLGLDFVKALKPVTYKWDKRSKYGDKTAADYDLNAQTPDGTHKEDWLDIGFKAQEVEALEIAAGYTKDNKTNLVSSHSDDGKQMGLQYTKFVPILVKAIQEQQALIESLTARIAALES